MSNKFNLTTIRYGATPRSKRLHGAGSSNSRGSVSYIGGSSLTRTEADLRYVPLDYNASVGGVKTFTDSLRSSGNIMIGKSDPDGNVSGVYATLDSEGTLYINSHDKWSYTAALASLTREGHLSANSISASELHIGDAVLSWDPLCNCLKVDKDFCSEGGISALGYVQGGSSGTGSGGESYDRLDSWTDYDSTAGQVLSAALGIELKEMLDGLPANSVNPYALSFGGKRYDGSAAITLTAADLGDDLMLRKAPDTIDRTCGNYAAGYTPDAEGSRDHYGVAVQFSNTGSTPGTQGTWVWQLAHDHTDGLLWRSRVNANGWTTWRYIAFTDSNVATATRLLTSRTIWGKPFNGTGNVDGHMSGVADINTPEAPARVVYLGALHDGAAWGTGKGAVNVSVANNTNQTPLLLAYRRGTTDMKGANRLFSMELRNNGEWMEFRFAGKQVATLNRDGTLTVSAMKIGGATLGWDSSEESLTVNRNLCVSEGIAALKEMPSATQVSVQSDADTETRLAALENENTALRARIDEIEKKLGTKQRS